jgi:hypothetical protein
MPSAPIAALSGSDSNHSSVNSIADIDRLRITRNMSALPRPRSFQASEASGKPSCRQSSFGSRGIGVR